MKSLDIMNVLLTLAPKENQKLWELWNRLSNNIFYFKEPTHEVGLFFYDLPVLAKDTYFDVHVCYEKGEVSSMHVQDKKSGQILAHWGHDGDNWTWVNKANVSLLNTDRWQVYTKYYKDHPITQFAQNDEVVGYVFHKESPFSDAIQYQLDKVSGPLGILPSTIAQERVWQKYTKIDSPNP